MAKTANELLRDAAIRHAVGLEKLALSQVKDIVGLLNDVDLDLVKQINERLVLFEGSGRVLSKAETKRLDALLEAVRIANAEGYEAIYKAMVAQGQDLASYEAAWQTAAIDHAVASVSATANLDLIQPTAASLKAIVTEQPLQGRLLKDWVDGLKQSQAQRIEQQIRLGMVEGEIELLPLCNFDKQVRVLLIMRRLLLCFLAEGCNFLLDTKGWLLLLALAAGWVEMMYRLGSFAEYLMNNGKRGKGFG